MDVCFVDVGQYYIVLQKSKLSPIVFLSLLFGVKGDRVIQKNNELNNESRTFLLFAVATPEEQSCPFSKVKPE